MLFANHGLPEVVVSDNGSSFTSAEFKEFMSRNGIKHIKTAPYHPSSNGQAERAVQTVKAGLRKMKGPLETRVARFLLKYRATPQATTGLTPAELLMGRKLRTHLDLLYPTKEKQIRQQERQAQSKGGNKKYCRPFRVGERVLAKNFATGTTCKWLPGVVKSLEGRTMVAVKLEDGRIWRRHIDHIIRSHIATEDTESDHESDFDPRQCLQSILILSNPMMINQRILEKKCRIGIYKIKIMKIMCKKIFQHPSSKRLVTQREQDLLWIAMSLPLNKEGGIVMYQ